MPAADWSRASVQQQIGRPWQKADRVTQHRSRACAATCALCTASRGSLHLVAQVLLRSPGQPAWCQGQDTQVKPRPGESGGCPVPCPDDGCGCSVRKLKPSQKVTEHICGLACFFHNAAAPAQVPSRAGSAGLQPLPCPPWGVIMQTLSDRSLCGRSHEWNCSRKSGSLRQRSRLL